MIVGVAGIFRVRFSNSFSSCVHLILLCVIYPSISNCNSQITYSNKSLLNTATTVLYNILLN